ncbi:MAG: hypothetical protein A3I44_05515 [Candidatus Sungbacteria bacterium RIFCSPLOWO2_02_FULL_51_17]|uniref:N-acetyltransferase domain-containing protein n=1 Tax=Candidatus Sungbacteria bacterium RIFCSPHIGHO2_02_FULL_51_29 TaxID=1802273 RepID=A0A1G2KRA8_9BACT|nr:MAG: hypothetical protein A2676_03840 [Candidatus Sungbacteria bacterium RIFCSPHIGHO2_01_FULL_51_22]OHA01966.1 MAG: hypothetical protein A3C16_02395 [Candidatus Sungbacteria bacterium RIFCSPHIGHO2_02_FULL_51_29]OHA05083.1 MAG: hypothetical protein A3B29_00380 [Candidatus Sungbacteria bacterium RIFCSPLOWO2_01_FULL_51_34]OHA11152.1 MAG: hypothetical protein A3I44_05515 [Candidatus Sungbacteria bacterium RIFCSPLOWO2_02_FULL_51_17]
MDITIRDARPEDIQWLLLCAWRGTDHCELTNFAQKHFSPDGERKHFLTGYPESAWVAEMNGRIVGYIHFFTDCWDGYQNELLGIAVDPALPSEDARRVEEVLKYACEHEDW